MSLFSERRIEQLFAENDQNAIAQITPFISRMPLPTEEKITEIIAGVAKKYSIAPVSIEPEKTVTEVVVEQIPGSRIDPFRFPDHNKSYPFAAVIYRIPIQGNSFLLRHSPRTYTSSNSSAIINGNSLNIKIKTQYANENLSPEVEEQVKREAVNELERIQVNIKQLNTESEEYNSNLLSRLNTIAQEKIGTLKAKTDREDRLNPFA